MVSQELLSFLLTLAAKLSGYPEIPLADLPPIEIISEQALADAVCPETGNGCTNIVATFETERYVIYVRDTLDLESAADNSFLLHELVHVLQHKARGDAIFADCPTTLKTETEAYQAQNAYLKREGQFLRFGEAVGSVDTKSRTARESCCVQIKAGRRRLTGRQARRPNAELGATGLAPFGFAACTPRTALRFLSRRPVSTSSRALPVACALQTRFAI